ncbi:MAG: hypothetical protein KGZ66_09675 [Selenomonadales bacterium]|jgi:diamine N-acetyltransferase|nr:hypothetical protein [Selenomonadales bacterium]
MLHNQRLSLREIDADSVRAICRLTVDKSQEDFVAPNAVSIAQAYFCQEAWFRPFITARRRSGL